MQGRRFKRTRQNNGFHARCKYPSTTHALLLVLYSFFLEKGWTLQIINKILGNFQRTASLFSHHIHKDFCFGIISIVVWGTKGVKTKN
jgi:hypothetical protein